MKLFLFVCMLSLAACNAPKPAGVTDLTRRTDLSTLKLAQFHGVRDGDRLNATAVYRDADSALTVEMNFAVGAPTKLQSGSWAWKQERGSVAERSVTFLGGQSGPPSLGGSFDLLDPNGTAHYRVTLPVAPLGSRLP